MLYNFFKTAWRQLWQNKSFGLINVVGLALAMACCLMILLWVQHERSIDNFHDYIGQRYTVYQTIKSGEQVEGNYSSPIKFNFEDNTRMFLLDEAKEDIPVVIASPIAWWAMNKWLQDFAYRIGIQWQMFAVAGLAAVVIALLTVSWQAIRAATASPVDSLRDE
ncbi:hypothetical protein ACFOET_00515 [Parapedobacter deserti]|uniref:ABC transporter permease n=1 Tax=Parapedobacter deserti TaxID=1912957 RepID=A0ABV7JFP5_9SPHI